MGTTKDIYFNRPDIDTWALARLHYSLLHEIQDSPLWEKEDIPDVPLTEKQMVSLVKGYSPGWECRYAPYFIGGWFYIARSGYWLKKFKYKLGVDGYYHVVENYSTEKSHGQNLLAEIICSGHFWPKILDDRLMEVLKDVDLGF